MSEAAGASGAAQYCVQCGTRLRGAFCYSCGAAAAVPGSPSAAPRPPAVTPPAAALHVGVAPRLPLARLAPPRLQALDKGTTDALVFGGAALLVSLIMLAFPLLGAAAALGGLLVLMRRQGADTADESDPARASGSRSR